jgi:ElaB/YqjD/DUF883 family membrane-anchored ribosome-binding protein
MRTLDRIQDELDCVNDDLDEAAYDRDQAEEEASSARCRIEKLVREQKALLAELEEVRNNE